MTEALANAWNDIKGAMRESDLGHFCGLQVDLEHGLARILDTIEHPQNNESHHIPSSSDGPFRSIE